MDLRSRRDFLSEVGKGMLTASVGTALASELGISPVLADGNEQTLSFGRLEPLVAMMQETSAERMLPIVVDHLEHGTDLRELVAAAALANARAFGGEDYVGFHAFMALMPAFEMSKEMRADRKALPVLKVLYRSTNQIQTKGGRSADVLHPVERVAAPTSISARDALLDAERRVQIDRAEGIFAGVCARSASEAFDDLQALVHDDTDVHRVVLAYRAWDLLGLTGKEYAHTTLRQSVRYCVGVEKSRIARGGPEPGIRSVLPKIVDQYHLDTRIPGTRDADDSWIVGFCDTLLGSNPAQAANAVGAALADGFPLSAIGEALSLASTQQVLRDPGRAQAFPGKPIGSVHGDSTGVHASDSMAAWRNIARVSHPRNALSGMVVAGYHLAYGSGGRDWKQLLPYPLSEHRVLVTSNDASSLLRDLDGAIRENDQARATAIVQRYGELGNPHRPVFDMLLRYATSEDGALHAEKYYRTVSDEFARSRKSTRWQHVTALARVTASEYGRRADGYEQACRLLKVSS